MQWDHVGIKVKDLNASLEFYCGKLGLKQLEVITLLGNDYYFVGNESIRIELEPGKPSDTQSDMAAMTGLYHIAFKVNDIDALAARLEAAGVKFRLPVVRIRPDRPKIAFIEDPDGVFIQLMDYSAD